MNPGGGGEARVTRRTLLYVDPDPATRLLVRRVLEPEGYTVVEAQTAREGRASVEASHPDIILVDVDVVKPADFLTPLRETGGTERIAILASTARVWPDEPENTLRWGFERVFLKPLDVDRLARYLDQYLPRVEMTPASGDVNVAVADGGPSTLEAEVTGDGDAFLLGDRPAAIEIRDVPALWRLNLTPVTASFVKSIPTTHGVLALLDGAESGLTLVAAYSIRPVSEPPAVGAHVPLRLVPWLLPALQNRQPVVLATESLGASPLVPDGSGFILVVPITTGERVYGVAILGEQRNPKFAPFAPQKVSQSVSEARQIATVVEALNQLDASIRQKRDEIDQVRMEAIRSLLGSVKESLRGRRSRKGDAARERGRRLAPAPIEGDEPEIVRLGLDLGARLGVAPAERETLRKALEVLDVGRLWLEDLLFPRTAFSEGEREAMLRTYAEHSAEILGALDWPAPVLDLVRTHQAWWNGEGHPPRLAGSDIPLAARILGVVSAYHQLVSGPVPEDLLAPADAVSQLEREAGRRFDPDVVHALAALLATGR